jgi:hypothetical protein
VPTILARLFSSANAEAISLALAVCSITSYRAPVSQKLPDHADANSWWKPSGLPRWLTEESYTQKIQPRLRATKVREIAQTIEVPMPYAALIRLRRRRLQGRLGPSSEIRNSVSWVVVRSCGRQVGVIGNSEVLRARFLPLDHAEAGRIEQNASGTDRHAGGQ